MAAEVLSRAGIKVELYDAMPSVGRKFLMAGKGGMNISHAEEFDKFLSRYGARRAHIELMLNHFNPETLRAWIHGLGIATFIGSSGRVFPTDMKAAPLLRAWLHRLRNTGVSFHMRHLWTGWSATDNTVLQFETGEGDRQVRADAVILALGGGSWARLGSTGAWAPLLIEQGIAVESLKPSNCGFNIEWSEHFRTRFAGRPLKSVRATIKNCDGGIVCCQHGELMITTTGVEGSLIYALSAELRNQITAAGVVTIYLDLAPDTELPVLIDKILQPRGKRSMANHLRKCIGIDGVKSALLREILSGQDFANPYRLGAAIKALPVKLVGARPLDEAISSAGGVMFEALNGQLMVRAMPGVFCAGEMLDWEAPTGGYLLTACFASGRTAGLGVLAWLQSRGNF